MDSTTFHRVAAADDLSDGDVIEVKVGDDVITVFRIGDEFHATAGICTHAYARLVEGYVEGDIVECPYHGGSFDIRTGKAVASPCTVDLKRYPLRVEAGEILVGIEA